MPDPTTNLATKRRDDAKAAANAAQQRLTDAQASINATGEAVAKATTAVADLDKQAAEIRQKLSAIPTPADGDALLAALEQTTIQARTGQAAILNAQGALLVAQAAADRGQLDLTNASAQLARAEADLNQTLEASALRAARVAALGTAPLSKLNADAVKALDETKQTAYKKAKDRIVSDIPDKLLKRAVDRRTNAVARTTQANDDARAAEDAELSERKANGGLDGIAQRLWALFQRAEAAVKDFVNAAKADFDQAQAILAQVADTSNSPLTAEQTASINAPDPLKGKRGAAVDLEKARDDKLVGVVAAQAALDVEILKAIAAGKLPSGETKVQDADLALTKAKNDFKALDDPWRAEEKDRDAKLGAVAVRQVELAQAIQKGVGVALAKTNLKNAKDAVAAAELVYKESDHGILHAWEAAVPDTTWRLFEDFQVAEQILIASRDADLAKLQSDLTTAEADYATAQTAADASANVLAKLEAEQVQREAQRESERQIGASRRFSASRGDS